jgi:hypothetical protein
MSFPDCQSSCNHSARSLQHRIEDLHTLVRCSGKQGRCRVTKMRIMALMLVIAIFTLRSTVPAVRADGAFIQMVTAGSNMGCTNPFFVWTTFINPSRGPLWVGLSFMTQDGQIVNIAPQDHSGEWAGTAVFTVYLDSVPTSDEDIFSQHNQYAGMQYATALWQGYDGTNMQGWMDSRGWTIVPGC